jgi:hypothetical protein
MKNSKRKKSDYGRAKRERLPHWKEEPKMKKRAALSILDTAKFFFGIRWATKALDQSNDLLYNRFAFLKLRYESESESGLALVYWY